MMIDFIGPFIVNILLWIIGLFILYRVILLAVREGINQSVIGEFVERKFKIEEDNLSDHDDLNND